MSETDASNTIGIMLFERAGEYVSHRRHCMALEFAPKIVQLEVIYDVNEGF